MCKTPKFQTLGGWTAWYVLFLAVFLSSVFFDVPGWLFWLAYGVFILGGLSLLIPQGGCKGCAATAHRCCGDSGPVQDD